MIDQWTDGEIQKSGTSTYTLNVFGVYYCISYRSNDKLLQLKNDFE